jgi:hypothetical protein
MSGFRVGVLVVMFVAIIVLLFAFAELRRRLIALETFVVGHANARGDPLGLRELLRSGTDRLIVLVTDDRCLGCHERTRELEMIVASGQLAPTVAVAIVKAGGTWDSPVKGVEYVVDPALVGALRPDATPQVIVFDAESRETQRRVVGSTAALHEVCFASNRHEHEVAMAPSATSSGDTQ